MFIAASTECFADLPFEEACRALTDLEYDKVELWMDEESDHLRPSTVLSDPEGFLAGYREMTRLTPVAFCLAQDVEVEAFQSLTKLAKSMKVTQITVRSAALGNPFNAEIDRLKRLAGIAHEDSVRLSIKTETGRLTEDPHTAVELCQAVKGLGITLDPSHYICGPHAGVPYDQMYPYVYHVHLRDTTPEELQVPVGLGEVDYTRLVTQLRRQDYRRALSVDFYADRIDPEQRPLEMRKLRMFLETLL